MSLADDLAAARSYSPHWGKCGFCRWVKELNEKDQALVVEAVAGDTPATALAEVFAKHGCKSDANSISRHRRGNCKQWASERAG